MPVASMDRLKELLSMPTWTPSQAILIMAGVDPVDDDIENLLLTPMKDWTYLPGLEYPEGEAEGYLFEVKVRKNMRYVMAVFEADGKNFPKPIVRK